MVINSLAFDIISAKMYTAVENCLIKPHERELYRPKTDYPKAAILMHHTSYFDLLREMSGEDKRLSVVGNWPHQKHNLQLVEWDKLPIAMVWACDTSEDAVSRLMEQYFWGARTAINIGSAGALTAQLNKGDQVIGVKAFRNNRVLDNLVTPEVEALSHGKVMDAIELSARGQPRTLRGNSWSVNNMMYTWEEFERAKAINPLCVEVEMATVCLTAGWLNANYAQSHGELAVGNLFYMSDRLPTAPAEVWVDTMNDLKGLVPFKRQVLARAMTALTELA